MTRPKLSPADEVVFREYEKQIDDYHKSLPLYSAPRGDAVYATLVTPDAVQLVAMMMMSGGPALSAGQAQYFKCHQEGVSQAMRWLCTGMQSNPVIPKQDDVLIEKAGHFVRVAADYVNVADFHKMYGRGQILPEIDRIKKTVTFRPVVSSGNDASLLWYDTTEEQISRGVDLIEDTDESVSANLFAVLNELKHTFVDGRIVFSSLPTDLVKRLDPIPHTVFRLERFALSDDADLIGFNFKQFKEFYSAVIAWSHAAFGLYALLVSQGKPQRDCLPTQVVNKGDFLTDVARLSALDREVVHCILNRVSYSSASGGDLMLSPFIVNDETVAWSPSMLTHLRAERNLLKTMSRGTKQLKERADTLNGSKEAGLALAVGQFFAKRGYQFKIRQKIACGELKTDLDVLLYNTNRPEQVLIVEVKAVLPPDEINEVDHATREMQHGQAQIRNAMTILDSMTKNDLSSLFKFVNWDRFRKYYPVVISSDAEPNELYDNSEIPGIAYRTLQFRLRERDMASPERFWEACRDRPWLSQEISADEKIVFQDIMIGEITYQIPSRGLTYKESPIDRNQKIMERLFNARTDR